MVGEEGVGEPFDIVVIPFITFSQLGGEGVQDDAKTSAIIITANQID